MRLKLDAEKWTLQYVLDAVGQHYAQAWMADYDPDELGEYLQEYAVSQTGSYQIDVEKCDGFGWKASRTEFLAWRYARAHPDRTKAKSL